MAREANVIVSKKTVILYKRNSIYENDRSVYLCERYNQNQTLLWEFHRMAVDIFS